MAMAPGVPVPGVMDAVLKVRHKDEGKLKGRACGERRPGNIEGRGDETPERKGDGTLEMLAKGEEGTPRERRCMRDRRAMFRNQRRRGGRSTPQEASVC